MMPTPMAKLAAARLARSGIDLIRIDFLLS